MGNKITHKHFEHKLHVLLSREDGRYYAHCLEFDLLAEGKSPAETQKNLTEMVFEYLQFYMANNSEQFLFNNPAPKQYWDILRTLTGEERFVPNLPEGLLNADSASRVNPYLCTVNAPACS